MRSDREIVTLYGLWSEEMYAASFMVSSPELVRSFRRWLDFTQEIDRPFEDYEREMLQEYRAQEAPDARS